MWKIEIVKATQKEIIGYDLNQHFQVSVSSEKLPFGTKIKKGDVVNGFKAGGTFYAIEIVK